MYNEDYFEDGIKKGISGYENYRWLPDLTKKMCESIASNLKISKNDKLLDYGCAKGFLVRAFDELGYHNVRGVDISEYAITHCDQTVAKKIDLLNRNWSLSDNVGQDYDFIICKDVLEHVQYKEIDKLLREFAETAKKCFIVVPLGKNKKYIIEEYEKDVTHVIREDLNWWKEKIEKAGFKIELAEYKFPGVKDNWESFENGNGFFVASRKTK